MPLPPLLLVAPLALAAQADMEVAAPAPPIECGAEITAAVDGVAQVLTAPEGGRWWLPRTNAEGDGLVAGAGPFSVVDGGGSEHAVDDLYVTPAAVALAVPAALTSGAVLQLRENGVAVPGALLRVSGEGVPSTVEVESAVVDGVPPEQCQIFCAFPGMTVPATPRLRLTASGGPAILDAWTVPFQGGLTDDLTPRVVDSQLVGGGEEQPFSFEHRLEEQGFTTQLEVRVRLLDPHTLQVLHDEVQPIGALPEILAESIEDVEPCDQGTPMTPGVGCASTDASSSAALALLLLALAIAFGRPRPRELTALRARSARSTRWPAS